MSTGPSIKRSGYAALVGRPNVGKSTLLNRLLGQKMAITSHKPQTTRHRILGVKTTAQGQVVYIDTPGIHRRGEKAMNRYLNRTAHSSLLDVDLALFVCQAMTWNAEDDKVLQAIRQADIPCIAVVNKVDSVQPKERMLPFLADLGARHAFLEVVPVSARNGANLQNLEALVMQYMPEGELIFPEDQVTDRSSRFFAAELLREQLIRRYHKELPYALSVEIEKFEEQAERYRIAAVIWVERESQRRILLGKQGGAMKEAASAARQEMARFFETRIHLDVWIKIKKSWSSDEASLAQLGYSEKVTNAALQPAYTLHSRRFRESSLIVEFLTRDHGRLAALAKGALRGKRPAQQLLQPFVPLLIDWRGRGELPLLVSLEPAAAITRVAGVGLYCGLYVNELVLSLTERGDPHSELFAAYALCMTELLQCEGQNARLEPVLRRFEVSLLDKLGLGLTLDSDCHGKPIQPGNRYRYDVHEGAVPGCATDEGAVCGATLLGLRDGEFADQTGRLEARALLRRVLSFHLGGRELKSRELFKSANPRRAGA